MKTKNMIKFLTAFILAALIAAPNLALSQEDEDGVTWGGAVRYNIFNKSWIDQGEPEFTWDTWRLNADGSISDVDFSFEYRFYPSFNTHFIHHGYLGYGFGESDNLYMKLGVSQVPFGITKFASHSWWFQIPYYVGLEDDYDIGVKFDYTAIEDLKLSFAYYRQMEPRGTPGVSARYSYDIVPSGGASIEESNQFNIRGAYDVTENIEIGASGQFGGIYNSNLDESEMSTAFAGHVVANFGNFNFKGEYIKYNYAAKDNNDNDLDVVSVGAYNGSYPIAAEASIYVAGLAYSIPVEWGPITNIQPYFDWSMVDKAENNFEPSVQMVPGFLISAGGIYTYVDYAMGKNHPWFNGSLGAGSEDANFNTRFNINIGYYF